MKLLNRKILIQIVLVIGLIISYNNYIYAEDAFELYTEGDFQYYIVNGAIEIAKYNGDDSEVTIPYKFGTIETKSIKDGAFLDSPVTKVIIPDNISHYDPGAFNSGTTLVFVDVSGNEVSDPTGNYPSSGGEVTIGGTSDNDGNGGNTSITDDSEFEDDFIDISEDLITEQETTTDKDEKNNKERNRISIRRRILDLFDASGLRTEFVANKIGYVLIGLSLVAIVGILIYYIKHNNVRK